MRIIAGKFKGLTLHISKDINTRPLKDLVRESIFNLITHSNKIISKIENSQILDLYSGTGSFGLECISRNAKSVFFIENKISALKILKKNIEKLNVEKETNVIFGDVFNIMDKYKKIPSNFDIVFCDPPFKNENIYGLIESIFKRKLLKNNGIIILHRKKNTKEELPYYFNKLDERIYGMSKIIFGNFLF